MFAEDAGVDSSLMASKENGEAKGMLAYQDTCGAYNITKWLYIMLMLFKEKNLLGWEE